MAKHGITKQDLLFVDEYFANGFNGSQAYSTVFTTKGLTPNNAKYLAYKLLNKTEVKLEVQKRWDEIKDANIIRREELLMELKETYFTAIRQQDHQLLLKTIDMINKMCGNYTTFIDANINQTIDLIIPGMEGLEVKDESEEDED